MLDKMTYTNHLNEQIVLGKMPYFANYSDLRDYAWEYTEANSKILAFNRKIRKYSLPVIIMCETEAEGFEKRNALFEIVEKDVLAGQYGTLQIGDYKLQCYVKESAKSDFLKTKQYMVVNLSIVTDRPFWTKEKTYIFSATESGAAGDSSFLDFPYDYPYDYTNSVFRTSFENENFVGTNFRMTIYGACQKPKVTINGHVYEVNATVDERQVLVIDSIEKTIHLIQNNGAVVNLFNMRNKDSYIFEKIPSGHCEVAKDDEALCFDLTLIEERSEPKWT